MPPHPFILWRGVRNAWSHGWGSFASCPSGVDALWNIERRERGDGTSQVVVNPATVCSSSQSPRWAMARPICQCRCGLHMGRKKKLIVGPHLLVRRRGTQAAAVAVLG